MAILRLKVKFIPKGNSISLTLPASSSIQHLKDEIQQALGIVGDQQRLMIRGRPLKDGSLQDSGIKEGDCVIVTVKKPLEGSSRSETVQSPAKHPFYGSLRKHLESYFKPEDLTKVLARLEENLERNIASLNLDEIERYCTIKLSQSEGL